MKSLFCRCSWRDLICINGALLLSMVQSDAQQWSIKRYDRADQLPASYLYHVYPDALGYLWIGSERGLTRYDGHRFTNYGIEHGMPDLRVDAILMDHAKRLWVGTRRGIVEFKADGCIQYPLSDSSDVRFVFSFMETSKDELLALTNVGVYKWNASSWKKTAFYPGYDSHACRQMVETPEGLYINYGDICVLQRPDQTFHVIAPKQKIDYGYLNLSQSGEGIYLSSIKGLFEITEQKLKRLPGLVGRQDELFMYLIDSDKNCWIGTTKGLTYYPKDDTSSVQTIYAHTTAGPISDICAGRDGVKWIADYNGLVKVTKSPFVIIPFQLMPERLIHNMILMPDGDILVNDGRSVFYVLDGDAISERSIVTYDLGADPELVVDNSALDHQSGKMWLQMRGYALALLDGNSLTSQFDAFRHLGDEVFDVIYDDYREAILTAVIGQNIPCQYDGTAFSRMQVTGCEDQNGIIVEIHQCLNGAILFSKDVGTIYAIDTFNQCRLVYRPVQGTGANCKFYNDPSGDVWTVFPGKGAQRFAVTDTLKLIQELTKDNGLNTNIVFELCFDVSGNLWVFTPSELHVFSRDVSSPDSKAYVKVADFNIAEHTNDVIGHNKITATEDGDVLVACKHEILRFNARTIAHYPVPIPQVHIERVMLNEEATKWSAYADTVSGIFGIPSNPELPYDMTALGIKFKGVLAQGAADVEYSHALHPVSKGWSVPSTEESVSFFKLPSGQYAFEIRARLPGSTWSAPTVFRFQVAKPYWETLWFRSCIVLFAAGILVLSFRYRMQQVNQKALAKEQLRELELNALKSQMNPHFVHNALNSIQSLILNDRTQEASSYVSKFARLLRQVLESGEKTLITLDQELNALRLYVDLERLRMDMDFSYNEVIDSEISVHQEMIPPLLLQPFVENALWHGLATKQGDKQLTLTVTIQDGWLICEVMDNGVGRKSAARAQVFPEGSLSKSTTITLKRLETFNQTPSSDPILYQDLSENGKPVGTCVIVRIRRESVSH